MPSVKEILQEGSIDQSKSLAPRSSMLLSIGKNFFYIGICVFVLNLIIVRGFSTPTEILPAHKSSTVNIEGTNFTYQKQGEAAVQVSEDYALQAGDVLVTDKATGAEIVFSSGAVLRIDTGTTLKVLAQEKALFGNRIVLQLLDGRLWINNIPNRDRFEVFSQFVSTTPEAAAYSFSYSQADSKAEIFSQSGNVLVSFISKDVAAATPRNLLKKADYLNQIVLPDSNNIVIAESGITNNFLQAKYLKLLKNVKISPLTVQDMAKFFDDDERKWLSDNKEKDRIYLNTLEMEKRRLIGERDVKVPRDNDGNSFFASLQEKMIIFPQKQEISARRKVTQYLASASQNFLNGNLVQGKSHAEQFASNYQSLQAQVALHAAADDLLPLVTEEYFTLFFVSPADSTFDFKNQLRDVIAEQISDSDVKARFLLMQLRDFTSEVNAIMKSSSPQRIANSKTLLQRYAKALSQPATPNLLKKVYNNVDYLIQERHVLFNLLSIHPELFDKELFSYVKILEDLISSWSREVVDEDDNRLFFRAQNLALYSDLIRALKKNQGNRLAIIDLGRYLLLRNDELVASGLVYEDNPIHLDNQTEFLKIADYMESDFFKDQYNEDDYKAYLKDLENFEKYSSNTSQKTVRRTTVVNQQQQIERIKEEFKSYGYKAEEISAVSGSNVIYNIGKVLVRGKILKGKYHLEGHYMFEIEVDGQLKKGEVHISLLPEVVKSSSEKAAAEDQADDKKDDPTPAEVQALSKISDDLEAEDIMVSQLTDIEVVDLSTGQFYIKKASYNDGIKVEMRFKYNSDTEKAEQLEVLIKENSYKKVSGKYSLEQLGKKAIDVYVEENQSNKEA